MSRYILGISALYHDAAAALIKDGRIVAAASEERFSRIKHDASMPAQAAAFCLRSEGITIDDVEHVVYYEKPLKKFERIIISQLLTFPRSLTAFKRSAMLWLTDKLWVQNALVKALNVSSERILFCDHHLSHAASAFYCSGAEEAAILTVDGVGEWASTTLFRGGPEGIERLREIRFPHSIGLLYSAFTAYLGFAVNNGEYKVMGMAAYGEPRFADAVRQILPGREDGSFEVNKKYISYHYSASESFTQAFVDLFGPPRFPGSDFDPSTEEGRRYADVAASIQLVTEERILALAGALHKETGLDTLCFAGGVALNSVANYRLLQEGPFKHLIVHPAAGDSGGAIGAALWCWREVLKGEAVDPGLRPDLGQAYDGEAIGEILEDLKITFSLLDDDALIEAAAQDIASGKVIGWMQGAFEWGPRALGFRSILADPANPGMKEHVNRSIKFREAFRPFAPSIRIEDAPDYFDLPQGGDSPLEWMLLVTPVKAEMAPLLPSITHADGTARVQTVRREVNPLYHRLIGAVGERTGHPVVLNTSFNLKGEPMVSSPIDALATFQRSGMDVLYLGGHRIERSGLPGESG